MKMKNEAVVNTQVLSVIYYFFVTSLVAFIISSNGCTEQPPLSSPDNLGQEYSQESLDAAIQSAVGQSLPQYMKVGDGVLYEQNFRFEVGPVIKLLDIITTIDEARDRGDSIEIAITDKEYVYDQRGKLVEEKPAKQSTMVLAKDNPPLPDDGVDEGNIPASFVAAAMEESGIESFNLAKTISPSNEFNRVTLHNLSVEKELRSPPQTVIDRTNCGGLANCMLNVTKVSFDIVKWRANNSFEKEKWAVTGTSDTPAYIGAWVNQCKTFILRIPDAEPGERSQVLTTSCMVLRDFVYGN